MLRLYHYEPTANSAKALIVLHEKQLPFESCWVDLHQFEQHEPDFLAVNPDGQVPVLVVDGHVITQSTIIMEYLEDAFPERPLRPADPVAKARVREWTRFVDEYFCPALTLVSFQTLVRPTARQLTAAELRDRISRVPLRVQRERWETIAGPGYSEDTIDDSLQRIDESMRRAESVLSRDAWLAGGNFSLADIAFFSMAIIVEQHFSTQCSLRDRPRCAEWLERVRNRSGVRAALAHSRMH